MSISKLDHIDSRFDETEYYHCEPSSDLMEEVSHKIDTQEYEVHFAPRLTTLSPVQIAANAYERGLISLGRAAEIADLPYGKMIEALKERGIPLRFGAPVEVAEKRSRWLVDKLKQLRSP